MKHFLFLTTNNLAANPRLTKELNLALSNGHRATVLTFVLGNWSDTVSNGIIKGLKGKYANTFELLELDATTSTWFYWFFWGLSEKWARIIYYLFKRNVFINALANTRRAIQLLIKANSLTFHPDLVLAHNMGALYPAFCLGKRNKVPIIFDMEDYYPGELSYDDMENERKRCEFLLSKLLPNIKAITSASPLIGKYTMSLIGEQFEHTVILNSFAESEFNTPIAHQPNSDEALKLIWFSQKIGPNRGLEQLFQALINISQVIPEPIQLTLIGEWDILFKNKLFLPFREAILHTSISVVVLPPMPQVELHSELCYYDIGLALETGRDLNNILALSNKIMAYAQAGLYILATNTRAQAQFLQECPDRGVLCGQSSSAMGQALGKLIRDRKAISKLREFRYDNGKKLAWEMESTKLIGLWNDAIKK